MENPAFIGSIIDVLVGIINISGGFYRNFDKIIHKNHLISVNLVKITKLGREIIEISIISPVQTHKLPFLQGINRNFDLFPQKWVLKQVFYSKLGYHWRNFANIYQVYVFFFISLHNSVGVCNTSGQNTYC